MNMAQWKYWAWLVVMMGALIGGYIVGQREERDRQLGHRRTPLRVLRIIDGDTIVVAYKGRAERVRLLGIDTPEWGEPGAHAAWLALSELVQNRRVELRFRHGLEERDRYGRLLAHVCLDGEGCVCLRLLESGHGRRWEE